MCCALLRGLRWEYMLSSVAPSALFRLGHFPSLYSRCWRFNSDTPLRPPFRVWMAAIRHRRCILLCASHVRGLETGVYPTLGSIHSEIFVWDLPCPHALNVIGIHSAAQWLSCDTNRRLFASGGRVLDSPVSLR